MEPTSSRPAARVVCLDRDGRVLLQRWYDRVARAELWEPPGGGLEPGEGPLDAARRELAEETGLPGSAVLDRSVQVGRDFRWLGVRYVRIEPFYLARFAAARPAVEPGGLTGEEREAYLGHVWAEELPAGAEPPELAEVVRRLTAGGRSPAAADR
ncbi:NUDIX domain-containing protein [Nonomuraea sp. NPDC050783]|uniref:NUDIX domain-containing protein n=1 Tax=Nonomuraea sp. NPDC050783 TaxID=3154634 RepID=UPI003467E82A